MKPQEFAKGRDIEMPVQHHPDLAHLAGYAAGAIDEAASLLVASHLALCPQCRSVIGRVEAMGGEMLERLPASAVATIRDPVEATEAPHRTPRTNADLQTLLPRPLRDYVGGDADFLRWHRLARGLEHFPIPTTGRARARLVRAAPRTAFPRHGHAGTELVLVLSGGYGDSTGLYTRGDVAIADADLVHQPAADASGPCVCLTVTRGLIPHIPFLGAFGRAIGRLVASTVT